MTLPISIIHLASALPHLHAISILQCPSSRLDPSSLVTTPVFASPKHLLLQDFAAVLVAAIVSRLSLN